MPIVRIRVKGLKGEKEYEAYLDTGASKCLVPEKDAEEIGLPYAGDMEIITGTGKDYIKLYKAIVKFLNKEYTILIFGKNLPEQAAIKAIVGRDILDNYKICFNGKAKEIEISELH